MRHALLPLACCLFQEPASWKPTAKIGPSSDVAFQAELTGVPEDGVVRLTFQRWRNRASAFDTTLRRGPSEPPQSRKAAVRKGKIQASFRLRGAGLYLVRLEFLKEFQTSLAIADQFGKKYNPFVIESTMALGTAEEFAEGVRAGIRRAEERIGDLRKLAKQVKEDPPRAIARADRLAAEIGREEHASALAGTLQAVRSAVASVAHVCGAAEGGGEGGSEEPAIDGAGSEFPFAGRYEHRPPAEKQAIEGKIRPAGAPAVGGEHLQDALQGLPYVLWKMAAREAALSVLEMGRHLLDRCEAGEDVREDAARLRELDARLAAGDGEFATLYRLVSQPEKTLALPAILQKIAERAQPRAPDDARSPEEFARAMADLSATLVDLSLRLEQHLRFTSR